MITMQLIRDTMPLEILKSEAVIIEDLHGNPLKALRIGGRFQYAGRPNANGRIYEKTILAKAVEQIQEDVQARRVLGEFDHPPDAKIHLDRVSHVITKLWMKGDEVFGECEILDKLPCGTQLRGLIESNVQIGISSRGVGDMEPSMMRGEEYMKVLPGYQFVTFDTVAEPSVRGSYLAVMEGKVRDVAHNMRANREHAILEEIDKMLRQ